MRKFIVSFVIVMLFSMYSGTVLAEKFDVCEAIKYDPKYKGLYGLCNAFWNEEDEEVRAAILTNWERKAGPGGPDMPFPDESGSVVCPCWPEGELDLGITPEACDVGSDHILAFYDGFLVQYGTGILLGLEGDSCEYNNLDLGQFEAFEYLTADELKACEDDLIGRMFSPESPEDAEYELDDSGYCNVASAP